METLWKLKSNIDIFYKLKLWFILHALIIIFIKKIIWSKAFAIDKFVGFKKNIKSSRCSVLHLWVKMQHVGIYTVNSSCDLTSYSTHSVAITSHVGIGKNNILIVIPPPNSMQGHSKRIHTIRPNIAGLILGPCVAVSPVLLLPGPVPVLGGLVEFLEFVTVLFYLRFVKSFGLLLR